MASTYSPDLRIELLGTGDQAGVWGTTTNTNLGTLIEDAISGNATVSVTVSPRALTALNGAVDESRQATLTLTTTLTTAFTVYAPPVSKQYVIYNNTAYIATIGNATAINGTTPTGGTTVAIPAGKTMVVWSDGSNIAQQSNHLISPSFLTPALGTPASGVMTNVTGTALGLTAGSAVTNANLTGAVTSVGNATSLGSFTSANLATALTDETGSGSAVFATSPTLVTPALGTPSTLVGTNITGTAIAFTASNVTTNANLTGDVTSVGNATTLATVASAGTTGSSTAIPVVTINAKGLTTSITTAAVVAPAGTLTGGTLASGVTASSLTSFGASPAFTGVPTAATASPGTNTTQLATTAFVTNVAGSLGTISSQNANAVAITGGLLLGLTV